MSQKRNFPQSLAVTLAFRLRSLKLRFFRSGTFVQAAFPLSYISTSSLRPLCSTAVTRFLATMGLSDSRQGPTTGYLFPVAVLPLRASQVPLPIFPRALPPLTPTSPTIACARYFIAGPRLPLLRLIGHSFLLCNEAETGSLALRLACSPCKASPVELLPLTLAWLLAERAIYKISSFQNIRSARIILALPKSTQDMKFLKIYDCRPSWPSWNRTREIRPTGFARTRQQIVNTMTEGDK